MLYERVVTMESRLEQELQDEFADNFTLTKEEMLTYEESFTAYNVYMKLLDKINLNMEYKISPIVLSRI